MYNIWFCFLFSVVQSIQVGFKANERNVVKPVIVCKNEEQRDAVTDAWSCISMGLVLVRKETINRRLFGFCRTRTEVGELLLLLLNFKSLILDSLCDTPHFFRSPSSLFSCPQKSHEKA